MHPSERNPKVYFDTYDTEKLLEALNILRRVYDYNYGSSRKSQKLRTIIHKMFLLVGEHCLREDLPNGFSNS